VSQIIKPKRKHTAGAPTTSDLAANEIAVNTSNQNLYVRDEANNITLIGGAQSPLDRDLDTDSFAIKSSKPNPTQFIGTPYVKMGSPLMVTKSNDLDALISVDVADVEVGILYRVKNNDNSFDWRTMGSPTISPSPGGSFVVTAQGPTGTASTMFADERWEGMLALDTSGSVNVLRIYLEHSWQKFTTT